MHVYLERLYGLNRLFLSWASLQTQQEEGWQENFPHFVELVDAACSCCLYAGEQFECSVQADVVADVISISSCSESCIDKMMRVGVGDEIYAVLVGAGDWHCRWQIYSRLDTSSSSREALLVNGVMDPHGYVARRAFLKLVECEYEHLEELSKTLVRHSDLVLCRAAQRQIRKWNSS